ncbi:MAG: hypothetical protein KatS3mg032_1395 [Cyclobacteriaceae bacterium]|nr:MAG: hypothetical protein KatS3mg032_1395 [Cyclobacteriaceae bacterium]
MKRFAAIILLLAMSVMLGGIYVYFAVRLVHLRQYMRHQLASLPEYRLDCLELKFDEFLKSRVDEHELKVNGRMFDIARAEIDGGFVRVYGLFDKDEDNLLAFLNTLLQRLLKDEQPVPALLFNLLAAVFILPDSIRLYRPVRTLLMAFEPICSKRLIFYFSVPTPPPEAACSFLSHSHRL